MLAYAQRLTNCQSSCSPTDRDCLNLNYINIHKSIYIPYIHVVPRAIGLASLCIVCCKSEGPRPLTRLAEMLGSDDKTPGPKKQGSCLALQDGDVRGGQGG